MSQIAWFCMMNYCINTVEHMPMYFIVSVISIAVFGYTFAYSAWWFYRGMRDGETMEMPPRNMFPFHKISQPPTTIKRDGDEGLGFYIAMTFHAFVMIAIGVLGLFWLIGALTP
ncbi:hypothetical protein [Asticcacaulis machinosus]|uniref:Uncharacterized protein n=1 Tax=Asticcacaulis machinosus TaxID=2984211 RepID=A0ABT5HGX2_9CAUL|nr:hypothetical protein [Asticcacaulis machinosus]MDC7675248.1 hypothetical protein [Asticcacaulis machinosus]